MMTVALDEETLLAAAINATGLKDWGGYCWGDDDFREPLALLIRSLREHGNLNAAGQRALADRLLQTLCQRLRVVDDRKKHPDIAAQKIEQPIFVTGNGRSGTTLLHNLLSHNDNHRAARLWEMMRPSPPPEAAFYDTDPRIEEIETLLTGQGYKSTAAQQKHAFAANRPEECSTLLELACVAGAYGAMAHVPEYTAYRDNADFHSPYRLHRALLQQLQWRGPNGRWVLKAPEHMFHLPELLDTYPDARVVFIHRDPARSIPSLISIVAQMRGLYSASVDIEAVKNSRLSYCHIMNRLREIRAAIDRPDRARPDRSRPDRARPDRARPDRSRPDRFYDVQYLDLHEDPVGTLRNLYAQMQLPFDDAELRRVERYLAHNPKGRFGEHIYSLRDYGLDNDAIDKAFGPYLSNHNVRLERA